MSQISRLLDDIYDTDSVSARLDEIRRERPEDEILAINIQAIEKRRSDLARRLDGVLAAQQEDVVQYRIMRTENARGYPARAVAAAMSAFQ